MQPSHLENFHAYIGRFAPLPPSPPRERYLYRDGKFIVEPIPVEEEDADADS